MRRRTSRSSTRRSTVVVAALALVAGPALVMATGGPAAAAGATSPPGCGTAVHKVVTNSTPMAISATGTPTVTSTVSVTGAGAYLTDVDVLTSITHTFSSDIDMTIKSPAGTIVTLTTDNGSTFDDVFNGTRWDDDADPGTQVPYTANPNEVTEHTYANLTPVATLVPEEALAAFTGENPNGTWTLTISDDTNLDGGSLNSWTLDVLAAPTAPTVTTSTRTNTTPAVITATGTPVVTSTISVTGAAQFLSDVNVLTHVTHTFSSDLDVTLKSPSGTIVTLTTDNGSTFDDVFNGTVWDDDADPGTQVPYTANPNEVTEHTYANLTPASPLVPEEGLGSFVGENPNGIWTLTISDDTDQDGGNLADWSLTLGTATCAVTAPDTAVSGASASAPAKQSAGKRRLVMVSTIGASAEVLHATVDGVLTVSGKKHGHHRTVAAKGKSHPLATQTFDLAVGPPKPVSSVLDGSTKQVKKLHRALLKALSLGQKATVTLTFTFTDAAGNKKTLTQTVKLKARSTITTEGFRLDHT